MQANAEEVRDVQDFLKKVLPKKYKKRDLEHYLPHTRHTRHHGAY
jgi:hypothetical protein